jgi:hypothetical protein
MDGVDHEPTAAPFVLNGELSNVVDNRYGSMDVLIVGARGVALT